MNDIHDIIFNDEIGEMNKTDKEIEKRLGDNKSTLLYCPECSKKSKYDIWDWMKLYKKIKEKYYDINDNNDFFNLEDSRYQVIDLMDV